MPLGTDKEFFFVDDPVPTGRGSKERGSKTPLGTDNGIPARTRPRKIAEFCLNMIQ